MNINPEQTIFVVMCLLGSMSLALALTVHGEE